MERANAAIDPIAGVDPVPTTATLLNDPAWPVAIQQAIAVRAVAGAVDARDQTPERARWNRVLVASVDRQKALAAELATPVALAPAIRATYEAKGTWVPGDVEYVVEQCLVTRAGSRPTDYAAITWASTDRDTVHTITGALYRAANDVLADPKATEATKAWVRAHLTTPEHAAETATQYVGLILTTPQLRVYGGDLSGVPDQEIADAIGALLTNLAV
jgi:hypothetical protein